ncbi:MAG: hypothetical protein ACKOCM_07215 [Cyanobacteriota bacterium]
MTEPLRLLWLRESLQNPQTQALTIAALMEASGLLACAATAVDYRQWCGESPRRTRDQVADGEKQ